jgi:hypothetical protein
VLLLLVHLVLLLVLLELVRLLLVLLVLQVQGAAAADPAQLSTVAAAALPADPTRACCQVDAWNILQHIDEMLPRSSICCVPRPTPHPELHQPVMHEGHLRQLL